MRRVGRVTDDSRLVLAPLDRAQHAPRRAGARNGRQSSVSRPARPLAAAACAAWGVLQTTVVWFSPRWTARRMRLGARGRVTADSRRLSAPPRRDQCDSTLKSPFAPEFGGAGAGV